MKIWKMMYDQSYESTIYKSNDYYEFFFKNFRGDFIQSYDENIEIETSFKGEKAECGETKQILKFVPARLDDVQFIKLKHDKYGECYMLNVIKVLDCLDESKIRYTSSYSIKKYVFKKNINYPSIFKITTDGKISNFVTEHFM